MQILDLSNNLLAVLPAGVFSDLRALQFLFLHDNPGSGSFLPIANAGGRSGGRGRSELHSQSQGQQYRSLGDNVVYDWTQIDNSDNAVELGDANTASISFVVPAAPAELEFELAVTGRGGYYRGTASVLVVGVSPTLVAVTSDPISTETYYVGEVIELTLTFDRPVTADTASGTPLIELDIGGERRQAHYVRDGGTRQLVFAYVVQEGDRDDDGIRICGASAPVDDLVDEPVDELGCPGAISLNGGSLVYQSGLTALLRHPGQADQAGHRVDGSRMGLRGGICGRTREVRDELVRLIGVADCSQVTTADLQEFTGTLFLSGAGIDTLKSGDFASLGALENLYLDGNSLTALPAGLFHGLGALENLYLYNNRLTALDAGLFSGLTKLDLLALERNLLTGLDAGLFAGLVELKTLRLGGNHLAELPAGLFNDLVALETLRLSDNRLTALPAGVFFGLTELELLALNDNLLAVLPAGVFSELRALRFLLLDDKPGGGSFRPIANAGADQAAGVGQSFTLRARASSTDPWGRMLSMPGHRSMTAATG